MTYEIGTPVIGQSGTQGVICNVLEPATRSFVIGAGMSQVRNEYEIAWLSGRVETLPDGIVKPFVDRATHLPKVNNVDDVKAAALAKQAADRAESMRVKEDWRDRQAAFRIEAREKTPSWAKAVICAELVSDRSDLMSDYHGSTTTRTVILGFSPHARDVFSELRKFAATFKETADLATASEKAEHREKYSMGAGYYLKNGFRDSDGWQVKKHKLYDKGADYIPMGEWHIAEPAAAKETAPAAVAASVVMPSGMTIEKHVHTKKGFDMWIVILPGRVERAEYDRLLEKAKGAGGWYSAKWGTTPAGFAFKSEAAANEFANGDAVSVAEPVDQVDAPKPVVSARPSIADKLRTVAEGMQKDIDNAFRDRQTNTPKRQREAASARQEGARLQRTQTALLALADLHAAGNVPTVLATLNSKAAVYALTGSIIDRSSAGYYDAGIDTGKPSIETPQTAALWSLLKPPSQEQKQAEELRRKTDALIFANIPGYFPTPAAIVSRMIDAAEIDDDVMTILEPEGGSGAILDMVKAAAPRAKLDTFERHSSLRDILTLKGYQLAGSDFMESAPAASYDRVLMNPPFENGQDIDHVRHAFAHLKEGGILVAIMSPGPFSRSDRKAQAFRDWFDELGAERVDLPAGAFKESGTGVGTVMVTIRK